MTSGRELAGFFSKLQWDDVPADVRDGARRMLLDTLGCIISARATEAGEVTSRYTNLLGGTTPLAAAYANGRLADAMDYNEGYSGAHFGCGAVAAALALARDPGASGKELLLAIAAGFELGARIQDAVGSYYSEIDGKQSFARVWGIATPIVYASAGAATRVLGYDEAKTTEAWGLAGSNTPIPVGAKWSSSLDLPNTKYCDAGWCSMTGVACALSAGFGNTGITSLLDEPDGLLRMVSATSPSHDALTAQLGERWCIRDVVYKDWPVCGLMEGPMRLLQGLVREHGITDSDITSIEVEVGSAILVPRFLQQHPRTFVSLQFNLAHAMAMTVLGIPPGPKWLSTEFAAQPQVVALRELVTASQHRVPWPPKSRARACSVRLMAAGRTWFAESLPAEGDPQPVWDDDWAIRKFLTLVQAPEAQRIVDAVMNIADLSFATPLIEAVERAQPVT